MKVVRPHPVMRGVMPQQSTNGAMMRALPILLSIFLVGQSAAAQQIPTSEAIGQSLVEAIISNDVVGYSQCWSSSRRMSRITMELGIGEAPESLQKELLLRNRSIAESFRKIQKLIDDAKIDRQTIRFNSCKVSGVRENKLPLGSVTKADQFSLLLSVGGDEWRLIIDGGLVDRGMWYFSDSPTTLFVDDVTLSFRDHRKEAN